MDRVIRPHDAEGARDPLIDEVRERRQRLLEDHGNDLERLCRAIRALEAQHPEKIRPKDSSVPRR